MTKNTKNLLFIKQFHIFVYNQTEVFSQTDVGRKPKTKNVLKMKWEDLKVYRPIEKTELTYAKKIIESIISNRLEPYGFRKVGKKLIRKSNDLIHLIFLDSRGSWSGASNSLKIQVAIVSIYDVDILVNNYEPISNTFIENLKPDLKNYYQITQEYELFAQFISTKIEEIILPYFDKYTSSSDIIKKGIKHGSTKNLVELCEKSKNIEYIEDLKCRKEVVIKKLKI